MCASRPVLTATTKMLPPLPVLPATSLAKLAQDPALPAAPLVVLNTIARELIPAPLATPSAMAALELAAHFALLVQPANT